MANLVWIVVHGKSKEEVEEPPAEAQPTSSMAELERQIDKLPMKLQGGLSRQPVRRANSTVEDFIASWVFTPTAEEMQQNDGPDMNTRAGRRAAAKAEKKANRQKIRYR